MTKNAPKPTSFALEAAEQGATVITANKRSARMLLQAYADRKRAQGEHVWRTPDVESWEAFVLRSWSDIVFAGLSTATLLNGAQERTLWERIVSQDSPKLLNPAMTAENAAAAWKLSKQFRIPLEHALYAEREGTAAFSRWSSRFKSECDRNGWMDSATLPDVVQLQVESGRISAKRHLVLFGFDEFTAQQRSLLNAFSDAGSKIQIVENRGDGFEVSACALSLHDSEGEIRTAATWARMKLEANPEARIGVVVPSLGGLRRQIESMFLAVLHPDQIPFGSAERRRVFELSVGVPLAERPVIATALMLVKLVLCGSTLAEAGSLLRSPFLAAGQAEASERALLDARLRKNRILDLSCEKLRDQAYGLCPVLRERLRGMEKVVEPPQHLRSPREWSELVAEIVSAAGWPDAERSLSSDEHQAVQAWAELLSHFGSLQTIEAAMDARGAYTRLNDCARRASFEPEKHDAPIQIMGMLEAAGSSFDCLWIMGLHDAAWPAATNPSPLIPMRLQVERQVPHSTSALDLRFAERVKARLLRSAPEVVFSYPRFDGDTALRPSPLLQGIDRAEVEDVAGVAFPTWGEATLNSASEALVDEHAPAVPEGSLVKGGTRILQMQSACPFRAFAELRLGAADLEAPEPGLDNRQRGTIVHKAMQLVWQELNGREGLVRCTTLPQVVGRCVSLAIEEASTETGTTWEQKLKAIEQGRITGLVLQLLEQEKRRAPFTVVASEQSETIGLGGLKIQVKVDRIDCIDDGRQVLIDYKTGDVSVRSWESERPEDPQLPAYAAVANEEIAAVAFAQLKAGDVGFYGYSPDPAVLFAGAYERTQPGKDGETLPQVIERWRNTVERLACEHREGRAEVDPAKGEQTCRYCPLPALCRVSQEDLAQEPTDEN